MAGGNAGWWGCPLCLLRLPQAGGTAIVESAKWDLGQGGALEAGHCIEQP